MSILVSVSVLTYNAALYVEETLESIFNQTYENIELIVSDDCSRDNTIEIVQKWCDKDRVKARFTDINIITVPKNTGVSANCNRAINASRGEWVKFIAGDDILLPNCIEDNMSFVRENPSANIVFSQVAVCQDTFDGNTMVKLLPSTFPDNLMKETFSAADQFRILIQSDRVTYTPSYFFKKQTLLKVGGYDETNRLVEDYPMWLKLTKAGERLHYFHTVTVGYRIHSKATNNTGGEVLFKPSVLNSYLVRKKYAHPHLPWEIVASEYQIYCVSKFFQLIGCNTKNIITHSVYALGCFYLNPFHYVYAMKKRMPSAKNNPFYS